MFLLCKVMDKMMLSNILRDLNRGFNAPEGMRDDIGAKSRFLVYEILAMLKGFLFEVMNALLWN